jgi:ABC-2 type transport system permease protein
MIQTALAFLKKDLRLESSYRISFIANFVSVAASLLGYYFIDKLFGQRMSPYLEEFQIGYFPYVLVGMALFSFIGAGLGSFADRLHYEQTQGTLEAILVSPCTVSTLLYSLVAWNILFALFDLVLYVIAGITLFKISFASVNYATAAVVLVLTIASFSALGIISACFVMVFKRGNPVAWLISTCEGLLGGVYFPVSVLPQWMQVIANALPITYAIRAIQLAVYRGYTVTMLGREIVFLFVFSVVLLPISFFLFTYSLKVSRRRGSLIQY